MGKKITSIKELQKILLQTGKETFIIMSPNSRSKSDEILEYLKDYFIVEFYMPDNGIGDNFRLITLK